jgi:hypothetical protein
MIVSDHSLSGVRETLLLRLEQQFLHLLKVKLVWHPIRTKLVYPPMMDIQFWGLGASLYAFHFLVISYPYPASHDEAIEILKIASQQIALAGQMPASQQSSAPEQPPAPQATLPPNSCPEVHISFFCISAISVISWVLHDFVI